MSIIPFPVPTQRPTSATTDDPSGRLPVRFDPPAVTQAQRNDPLALARADGIVAASSR